MSEHLATDALARLLAGLETTPQTVKDIRTSLKERGYDPATEVASFQIQLSRMVARYTWKEKAFAKHEAFTRQVSELRSWASKTNAEIDAAFQKLVTGRLGHGSHGDFALAFRNLETVTREEKVAVLDDLALLDHDDEA